MFIAELEVWHIRHSLWYKTCHSMHTLCRAAGGSNSECLAWSSGHQSLKCVSIRVLPLGTPDMAAGHSSLELGSHLGTCFWLYLFSTTKLDPGKLCSRHVIIMLDCWSRAFLMEREKRLWVKGYTHTLLRFCRDWKAPCEHGSYLKNVQRPERDRW